MQLASSKTIIVLNLPPINRPRWLRPRWKVQTPWHPNRKQRSPKCRQPSTEIRPICPYWLICFTQTHIWRSWRRLKWVPRWVDGFESLLNGRSPSSMTPIPHDIGKMLLLWWVPLCFTTPTKAGGKSVASVTFQHPSSLANSESLVISLTMIGIVLGHWRDRLHIRYSKTMVKFLLLIRIDTPRSCRWNPYTMEGLRRQACAWEDCRGPKHCASLQRKWW